MLGNWELYKLSVAEHNFVLADAHAEAALFLAEGLRTGAYRQTFSHAKVIMSLHHHAAELFLKYALKRAGEPVPAHHHLRALWDRYKTAYPDSEFEFVPPFVPVFLGHTDEQLEQTLQEEYASLNRNKTDQALRYHTDRNGRDLPGIYGIDPETYPEQIAEMRNRIRCLHDLIEKRMAKMSDAKTNKERE